jgi:hypothetical protein
MTRLTKLFLVLTILILLGFAAPAANAATLIIGSSNDLSRYPFGRDPSSASGAFPDFAAGGIYQQIYATSAFSGPVIITQIAFASKGQLTSGPGTATYNFNVGLSTTAVGPNGLSTNLAANRGADFTQVFSGPLTATITANNQFDLVIDIAPFTYDPAQGNLLLDVTFNSPTQFTGGQALYYNAGFSASTSRAANPSGSAGGAFTDGFGLETRFTTKRTAQVILGNLAQTFDGSPKSVTVTTDPPGLEVVVTYDGSATPPGNAGTYAVAATVNDPNFIGQASGNLIVSKAVQQLAFDPLPNKTLADPDFSVSATASSNLAVSFAASGACTLNGNQVHLTGAGACTITASQDGNANINAAVSVARTFSIGKADQQITFEALADRKFGDADFDVSPTASSNLAVSLAATGNCTLSGPQVHLTGAGSCTITASQDGSSIYNPATAVARTFGIGKAGQQLTFDALPSKKFGDADFNVSATASSNLAVSFSANGNCTLTGAQVHLTGAGNCTITASQGGDSNYDPAPEVARSFSISKADQTISFGALSPKTFGDPDFNISATVASGLPVSFTASGQCAVTASTVHLNSAGGCTIIASQGGDDNYNAASDVTRNFSIGKAGSTTTVTISNATFDGLTHGGTVVVTGAGNLSQNLTVAYSGRNGTIYGPSATAPTSAGDYIASASFDGDESHDASRDSKDFSIAKATATITLGDLNQPYTGTAKNATASTNPPGLSGITISYSRNGTPVPSPVNSGSYDVLASLTNSNYQADNATGTLVINKATAAITLGNLIHTYDGSGKAASATTDPAGKNVLISYSLNGQVGATPTSAGSYEVTATIDDANYQGSATATLVIERAAPVITWANPGDIIFGTALSATQLNATASVAGSFAYTPAAGTVLNAGNGQILTVNFAPTDTNNYNSTTKSVTVNVLKADQTITFNALADKIFGDAPFNLSAASSSGQAVSFSIISGPATVSGDRLTITGVGHVVVRASLAGDSNHNAAPAVDRSFEVTAASATIALSNLAQTYDGTAKAPTVVINPAGLSFTLTYSRDGQPVASPIGAGSYDVTARITDPNYQGGATAILVINKATPTLTWNNPASIASGTALSAAQLNATANVPGTFTYDPPAGTVLSVGSNQLAVTFTPTDSANYTTASQSVQLRVEQLATTDINLSQATYNADEADGHITITVNRTGDTAGEASADFSTSDLAGLNDCNLTNGIASSRCDYATSVGTLRFLAGETTKTISIPIVDDAYVEGGETFTLTLSNASGATLGATTTATLTINDNDTTQPVSNPIEQTPFFVRQHYIDFLNREPDPNGFAAWVHRIDFCGQPGGDSPPCDRIEVSSDFFRSPEFHDRGYFIYKFYAASLGRFPRYAEFIPDLAKVSGFQTPAEQDANKRAFIEEFITRAEFRNRYDGTSNDLFVDRILSTAGVTSPNRQVWVDTLNLGAKTRAQVLKEIAGSAEVDAKFFNEAFVVMQYFGYLRRDPDALYTHWIETLDRTGDYRLMVNGFINSGEYVQRFGP